MTSTTQKKKPLWRITRTISALALCAATLLAATPRAEAGSATLSWSAPTTNSDGTPVTSLSGYKVYTRTATGSYATGTDVGNVTSYALNNLTDGSTYYFAVTAYNSSKVESAKSNEVSKALTATTASYTITANAGSGGTVTATNNGSVNTATNGTSTVTTATVTSGATQAFSITPASGYSISAVTVDGASVGAVGSYSFTNVTANHTISATFAASGTGTGTGTTGGTTTTATTAFAVNAGGTAYTNGNGVTYAADTKYSGGSVATVTSTISNTTEGKVYQSERYGNFTYSVPLTNGNYAVTLKFAETYWTAAGKRVFNVAVNGATAVSNLDIYAKAGGSNKAYDVVVPATVSNGTLTIGFTSVTDNAKVCAISVAPAASGSKILFANNAGGGSYLGSGNIAYTADAKYTGGSVASVTAAIAGTTDQSLYQTERYGNFSYSVPVANGNYTVTLKFAETYWTAAGKRVFNVAVNGATALSNLDIYAKAGGSNKAYDVDIPVTVTNGTLNINFNTVVDNAKVDAIIIKSV